MHLRNNYKIWFCIKWSRLKYQWTLETWENVPPPSKMVEKELKNKYFLKNYKIFLVKDKEKILLLQDLKKTVIQFLWKQDSGDLKNKHLNKGKSKLFVPFHQSVR